MPEATWCPPPSPQLQACHLSTWNRAHLAAHEHITNNRDPELRQARRSGCCCCCRWLLLLQMAARLPGALGTCLFARCHLAAPPFARALPQTQALRGVLTSDPEIAPRLCQLSRIFGYDSGPACSVEAPASGTASPGGSSTGGEGVAQEGPGLVQLIGSRGDGGDA